MEILKETRSVCPECLKTLPAEVFVDADEVWMRKACPEHGETKGLIERDVTFYKRVMNPQRVQFHQPLRIMAPITHRCNLDCAFCYVPNRHRPDLTIEDLVRRTASLPPFLLCLTGGEPTLHDKLLEMIRIMKARPNVISVGLVSNGIKLADADFVRGLEQAGLEWALFSFNGFSDEIYLKTNQKALFDVKMQAMEVLMKSRILVGVSPTVVRGLNEPDILQIIGYMLEHRGALRQLRMRSAANVGVHRTTDSLCTSELLDLALKPFGVDRDFIMKDFNPDHCYHSPYQFNFIADLAEGGADASIIRWGYGFYAKPGAPDSLPQQSSNRFHFNLWGWPDRYSIDLDDVQSSGVRHMTHDGRILSFSEGIIRYEEL